MKLTDLIADAPWREAVTYRDTWPHDTSLREGQAAGTAGGGLRAFPCRGGRGLPLLQYEQHLPVHRRPQVLADGTLGRTGTPGNYVINRARLYRDRRDFVIQPGDTGKPEAHPAKPAYQG